jgi:glycerol-3-phosphate dehydrogenase (NAD(P)+)
VQKVFSTDRFRVYTSLDCVGVELAGALKNVIAIAAGICDGAGFGDNAKAALITRGLVEIARLGEIMGAKRSTFAGLAGMGDLITTCFSPFGRNLAVGRAIGKGKKLADILKDMEQVAEGVPTTRSAKALRDKYQVEMPITEEVFRVLFEDKSPTRGLNDLMQRDLKPEED